MMIDGEDVVSLVVCVVLQYDFTPDVRHQSCGARDNVTAGGQMVRSSHLLPLHPPIPEHNIIILLYYYEYWRPMNMHYFKVLS